MNMLYKYPSTTNTNVKCDILIDSKYEVKEFDYVITEDIKDGYYGSAQVAYEESMSTKDESDQEAKPSREELLAKAKELGLEFQSNIKTKNLILLIDEALSKLDDKDESDQE